MGILFKGLILCAIALLAPQPLPAKEMLAIYRRAAKFDFTTPRFGPGIAGKASQLRALSWFRGRLSSSFARKEEAQ